MDTTGNFPALRDSDPLYEMAEYTRALSTTLTGTWTKLTLTSPWIDYTGGGQYRNGLWYRKTGVTLNIHGIVRSGGLNSVVANLPVAVRPLYSTLGQVSTSGGPSEVNVDAATGNIQYRTGTAAPTYAMFNLWIPLT